MFTLIVVVCGLVGLAVGSFLNVVIWRVPNRNSEPVEDGPDPVHGDQVGIHSHEDADRDVRDVVGGEPVDSESASNEPASTTPGSEERKESIAWPGSYCPQCRTPIKPYDNIPLVSWLVLGGKCRACKARIPVRYPLVELTNMVLWILVALVYWDRAELPAYLVLAAGLVALSAIDFELKLLPTRIVFPLGVMEAVLLGGAALYTRDGDAALRALLAALGAYVVIRFIYEVTRGRGIGYGDVRLSFVLGLALGWLGWGYVIGGVFAGFFFGAVVGLALLVFRVVDRRTHIPFGPFLALGTMTFILAGAPILDWYLGRA